MFLNSAVPIIFTFSEINLRVLRFQIELWVVVHYVNGLPLAGEQGQYLFRNLNGYVVRWPDAQTLSLGIIMPQP
jgi:hypothetical protein